MSQSRLGSRTAQRSRRSISRSRSVGRAEESTVPEITEPIQREAPVPYRVQSAGPSRHKSRQFSDDDISVHFGVRPVSKKFRTELTPLSSSVAARSPKTPKTPKSPREIFMRGRSATDASPRVFHPRMTSQSSSSSFESVGSPTATTGSGGGSATGSALSGSIPSSPSDMASRKRSTRVKKKGRKQPAFFDRSAPSVFARMGKSGGISAMNSSGFESGPGSTGSERSSRAKGLALKDQSSETRAELMLRGMSMSNLYYAKRMKRKMSGKPDFRTTKSYATGTVTDSELELSDEDDPLSVTIDTSSKGRFKQRMRKAIRASMSRSRSRNAGSESRSHPLETMDDSIVRRRRDTHSSSQASMRRALSPSPSGSRARAVSGARPSSALTMISAGTTRVDERVVKLLSMPMDKLREMNADQLMTHAKRLRRVQNDLLRDRAKLDDKMAKFQERASQLPAPSLINLEKKPTEESPQIHSVQMVDSPRSMTLSGSARVKPWEMSTGVVGGFVSSGGDSSVPPSPSVMTKTATSVTPLASSSLATGTASEVRSQMAMASAQMAEMQSQAPTKDILMTSVSTLEKQQELQEKYLQARQELLGVRNELREERIQRDGERTMAKSTIQELNADLKIAKRRIRTLSQASAAHSRSDSQGLPSSHSPTPDLYRGLSSTRMNRAEGVSSAANSSAGGVAATESSSAAFSDTSTFIALSSMPPMTTVVPTTVEQLTNADMNLLELENADLKASVAQLRKRVDFFEQMYKSSVKNETMLFAAHSHGHHKSDHHYADLVEAAANRVLSPHKLTPRSSAMSPESDRARKHRHTHSMLEQAVSTDVVSVPMAALRAYGLCKAGFVSSEEGTQLSIVSRADTALATALMGPPRVCSLMAKSKDKVHCLVEKRLAESAKEVSLRQQRLEEEWQKVNKEWSVIRKEKREIAAAKREIRRRERLRDIRSDKDGAKKMDRILTRFESVNLSMASKRASYLRRRQRNEFARAAAEQGSMYTRGSDLSKLDSNDRLLQVWKDYGDEIVKIMHHSSVTASSTSASISSYARKRASLLDVPEQVRHANAKFQRQLALNDYDQTLSLLNSTAVSDRSAGSAGPTGGAELIVHSSRRSSIATVDSERSGESLSSSRFQMVTRPKSASNSEDEARSSAAATGLLDSILKYELSTVSASPRAPAVGSSAPSAAGSAALRPGLQARGSGKSPAAAAIGPSKRIRYQRKEKTKDWAHQKSSSETLLVVRTDEAERSEGLTVPGGPDSERRSRRRVSEGEGQQYRGRARTRERSRGSHRQEEPPRPSRSQSISSSVSSQRRRAYYGRRSTDRSPSDSDARSGIGRSGTDSDFYYDGVTPPPPPTNSLSPVLRPTKVVSPTLTPLSSAHGRVPTAVASDRTMKDLRLELHRTTLQLSLVNAKCSALTEFCQQLKMQKSQLTARIEELCDTNQRITRDFSDLEAQTKEVQTLTNEVSEKNKELLELTKTLSGLEKQLMREKHYNITLSERLGQVAVTDEEFTARLANIEQNCKVFVSRLIGSVYQAMSHASAVALTLQSSEIPPTSILLEIQRTLQRLDDGSAESLALMRKGGLVGQRVSDRIEQLSMEETTRHMKPLFAKPNKSKLRSHMIHTSTSQTDIDAHATDVTGEGDSTKKKEDHLIEMPPIVFKLRRLLFDLVSMHCRPLKELAKMSDTTLSDTDFMRTKLELSMANEKLHMAREENARLLEQCASMGAEISQGESKRESLLTVVLKYRKELAQLKGSMQEHSVNAEEVQHLTQRCLALEDQNQSLKDKLTAATHALRTSSRHSQQEIAKLHKMNEELRERGKRVSGKNRLREKLDSMILENELDPQALSDLREEDADDHEHDGLSPKHGDSKLKTAAAVAGGGHARHASTLSRDSHSDSEMTGVKGEREESVDVSEEDEEHEKKEDTVRRKKHIPVMVASETNAGKSQILETGKKTRNSQRKLKFNESVVESAEREASDGSVSDSDRESSSDVSSPTHHPTSSVRRLGEPQVIDSEEDSEEDESSDPSLERRKSLRKHPKDENQNEPKHDHSRSSSSVSGVTDEEDEEEDDEDDSGIPMSGGTMRLSKAKLSEQLQKEAMVQRASNKNGSDSGTPTDVSDTSPGIDRKGTVIDRSSSSRLSFKPLPALMHDPRFS